MSAFLFLWLAWQVVNDSRDVMPVDVDFPFSCAAGAMVCYYQKYRVVKPGLILCSGNKFSQCIIGIFYGCIPATLRQFYFPGRKSKWLVIGGGHYKLEERLINIAASISVLNGLLIQVFIANAPGIFKAYLAGCNIIAMCINML